MRYLDKILAEDVTKIFRKSQKKLLAWDLAKKSYIEKTWRGANLAPPPGPDRVKKLWALKSTNFKKNFQFWPQFSDSYGKICVLHFIKFTSLIIC